MICLERTTLSFGLIWLLVCLGLGLTLFAALPVEADDHSGPAHHLVSTAADVTSQAVTLTILITPTNGVMVSNPRPVFDWADASTDAPGGIVSYTLLITSSTALSLSGQANTTSVTTTSSIYTPTRFLPNGVYTWTVQAHDAVGNTSDYVTPPATFTLQTLWQVFLPIVFKPECPAVSDASFDLIPIDGPPADHPDYLHGDLNLALRGYAPVDEVRDLVDYNGSADPNAPQLAGLFEPNQFPGISTVYQVNQWIWNCGMHGCPGPANTDPKVTLAGLNTTRGEFIYIPERPPEIYGGGYKVMVLYAEEKRITLGYTRRDTVAAGYAVHIEDVCVDPNLLALYRAQTNVEGWHSTGYLPALRNNQILGTAFASEIKVAIRDRGTFMDPRSRKDWWQGY